MALRMLLRYCTISLISFAAVSVFLKHTSLEEKCLWEEMADKCLWKLESARLIEQEGTQNTKLAGYKKIYIYEAIKLII